MVDQEDRDGENGSSPAGAERARSETTLVLERTLEDSGLTSGPVEPLKEAQQIGRFIIQQLIGAGATGHVYKAWDPELHRSVALKLLVSQLFSPLEGTSEHTTRLRLEAQALARLNHPHVVTVHEVGTHSGAVFVAMEFVEGATLREWLRQTRRSVSEILSVMLDAASGLAAAHDAGIIHRDFKPDNVMVPASGGLKIVDFGLARPHSGEDDRVERGAQVITPPVRAREALRHAKARPQVTTTGALVGTPAYMAPDVLDGAAASPAADDRCGAPSDDSPASLRAPLLANERVSGRADGRKSKPRIRGEHAP